jgi:hypothetical protein
MSLVIATAILTIPVSMATGQKVGDSTNPNPVLAVDIQIDKPEALVAERIQVEVTATAPEGVSVKFPEIAGRLGNFEVVSLNDTPDIPSGADRQWIRHIGLESLISGELEIPAMEIIYVDRRGSQTVTGNQKTAPRKITIRSTLEGVEDPTKFRDIKSVVFLPESQPQNHNWTLWGAGAGGLTLLAAIAFLLVTRYKPVRSPKQWALNALDDLRNSRALADGDAEQIYVRVISILRTFFDEQFGISAPRFTTDEFLSAMQADGRLSRKIRDQLKELLTLADLVKFAGMLPEGQGLMTVVDQAKRVVEHAADHTASTGADHQAHSSNRQNTAINRITPLGESHPGGEDQ